MADVASGRGRRRGRAGLIAPVAVTLLVLAALLAAEPALSNGPLQGLALGLVAVLAIIGAFALHALLTDRAPAQSAAGAATPDYEALVRALAEPAALVGEDGVLDAANEAWRELVGPHRRLQRAALGDAPALLRAAARDGQASRDAALPGPARRLEAARLDAGRFLVRLSPAPAPPSAPAQPAAMAAPVPASLDPFAAASPFGAAIIQGSDPFAGGILEVNEAWAAIAGAPPGAGETLGGLLTDASRADASQRLAAGGAGPFEVTPKARPNSVAHLYVSRLDGHAVAYLVDVTEQKQMQAQLAQSSKMQAIGQLAGGVAHDFNNLLTAILMNLSELETRHPLGDPSFDGLSRIRENALRAAGLVGQLLTFPARSPSSARPSTSAS